MDTDTKARLIRNTMLMRDCSLLGAYAWLAQPHKVQVRLDGLDAWMPIDWADFDRFVGGYEGQDLAGEAMQRYLSARLAQDVHVIDARVF